MYIFYWPNAAEKLAGSWEAYFWGFALQITQKLNLQIVQGSPLVPTSYKTTTV